MMGGLDGQSDTSRKEARDKLYECIHEAKLVVDNENFTAHKSDHTLFNRRRGGSPVKLRGSNMSHQNVASRTTLATLVAITLLFDSHAQADLVDIYHRYRPVLMGASGPVPAAQGGANQTTTTTTEPIQLKGIRRRATIELSSPMKRIMELIGHHAPVIVLDSSSQDSPTSNAAEAQPVPAATGALRQQHEPKVGRLGDTSAASSHQLDGQQQQQQQHWAIMDTSQILAAQPQLSGQQQQLIATSVQPNEQYFTFTPYGLAPTGNPFADMPQTALASPYLMQQPAGQPVSQSSQNYQQQPAVVSNQVQPVFLSSYVPELPASSGQPASYNGEALTPIMGQQYQPQQSQQPQSPQHQPNSIQQIQRAQKEAPDEAAKETAADAEDKEADEPDERPSGKDEDEARSSSSSSSPSPPPPGPSDEADEGTQPQSGSSSYEEKYDSDKDEAQQRPTRSRAGQQLAAAASDTAKGLVGVGLNDDCLQCICRASSGCDHLLRCITIGAEDKFCGPFQLSEEYWQRAGSPGDSANNFHSFEECANDADCAVETVSNYMKKYFKDCDGDELVTCLDYARLHRLKPNECDNTQKLHRHFEGYWEKFKRCAESYNKTRNGDDEDI